MTQPHPQFQSIFPVVVCTKDHEMIAQSLADQGYGPKEAGGDSGVERCTVAVCFDDIVSRSDMQLRISASPSRMETTKLDSNGTDLITVLGLLSASISTQTVRDTVCQVTDTACELHECAVDCLISTRNQAIRSLLQFCGARCSMDGLSAINTHFRQALVSGERGVFVLCEEDSGTAQSRRRVLIVARIHYQQQGDQSDERPHWDRPVRLSVSMLAYNDSVRASVLLREWASSQLDAAPQRYNKTVYHDIVRRFHTETSDDVTSTKLVVHTL